MRRLCADTGDDFELREYERLSPLRAEATALRDYRNVRAGDCVVAFSREDA